MLRGRAWLCVGMVVLSISACDIIYPPEELQPAFSFTAPFSPRVTMAKIKRQGNTVQVTAAEEKHADKASPAERSDKDEELLPFLKDCIDNSYLNFLPVYDKQALLEIARPLGSVYSIGQVDEATRKKIESIDFSTQLAVLVAHPADSVGQPAFFRPQIMSFDSLSRKYSNEDALRLGLSSKTVGNALSPLALGGDWESKVFVFDRKSFKRIELAVEDHVCPYEIEPNVPAKR